MSFVDMLMYYGHATSEKPAVILADRILTFGMLAAGIRSVAQELELAGIDRTQTVAVCIESPTRHLIVVSALYRIGVVSVSISGDEDFSNLGVHINVAVCDKSRNIDKVGRILVMNDDWFLRKTSPHEAAPTSFNHNDLARIIMSSGTTATPKAIGQTARVVEDRIITGRRILSYAPWDRMMCLPPLTSSLGFGSSLHALAYGHSVVVADSAIDALQMIALYQVDLLVANPRQLKSMIEQHMQTPIPTPSLRLIKYGGSPLTPSLATEVRNRLCKDLICVYSSTESGPIAFAHFDHILTNPGSTGIVAPWIDLEIVDLDGKSVDTDTAGRLRVRSQWQGYDLNKGPAAAEDWMYTGDVAKLSKENSLTLVGRYTDAIKLNGALVYPEQIEHALINVLGIKDVAAIGMKNAIGNDSIALVVVASGSVDQHAINEFLVKQDPNWHVAQIRTTSEIPRNKMGKIQRHLIRQVLLSN